MTDELAARSEISDLPIMLVEDNPDDADLTIRALRKCGIDNEVLLARDGMEALAMLGLDEAGTAPVDPSPAVIMLDIKMPKVDGFEVLKAIRSSELHRFLPVVMLTSSGEDRDRAEAYSLGVNSYVQKPIESEAFLEAVGRLGLYWLGINRNIDSPVTD